VILWTIQSNECFNKLIKDGVLHADGRRVIKIYRPAYRWMIQQMKKRLLKSLAGYPLWGWYRFSDVKNIKPDLRSKAMRHWGPKGIKYHLIKFEIDDDLVLLSRWDHWHSVLGGWYDGI